MLTVPLDSEQSIIIFNAKSIFIKNVSVLIINNNNIDKLMINAKMQLLSGKIQDFPDKNG